MEFTLKLHPDTRDLIFDAAGIMQTVEGDNAAAQNVDVVLSTWLGEFFLDETHGTDYGRILSQDHYDVLDGEAEEVVRDGILQEPQMSMITSVDVSIRDKRTLVVGFTGELASGTIITREELTQRGERS